MAVRAETFDAQQETVLHLDIGKGDGAEIGTGDLVEIEYLEYMLESGPAITVTYLVFAVGKCIPKCIGMFWSISLSSP